MACRFYKKNIITRKFIGSGANVPIPKYVCLLKKENVQVYRELLRLGLQNTMYTDDCPVASSNKWLLCPFREKPLK